MSKMSAESNPGPIKSALAKQSRFQEGYYDSASGTLDAEEEEEEERDIEDDIQYDIRLLEKNIGILLRRLNWSARILINIFPFYPKWVFNIGKPWCGFDHTEGFLFFYAFALTLHFIVLVFGCFFKFISEEPFYKLQYEQVIVEWVVFGLTLTLYFYYRCKSYLLVYFWVISKGYYWSSVICSARVPSSDYWRYIEVPIHLTLDVYITLAMLMHSLIDYSRNSFSHAVLSEILEEELRIALKLLQDEDREYLEDSESDSTSSESDSLSSSSDSYTLDSDDEFQVKHNKGGEDVHLEDEDSSESESESDSDESYESGDSFGRGYSHSSSEDSYTSSESTSDVSSGSEEV